MRKGGDLVKNCIIARIENYKMADVGGVGKEQEREQEYINKYYNNPDFDINKINKNITLVHDAARDGKSWEKYIKDYHAEHLQGRLTLKGGERSQTNVATQFMITATPQFFDNTNVTFQKEFFERAFESLQKQYPDYHWAEVTIHLDERTPHMHALALPIYHDKEKDRYILSTTQTQKGREHYREFQDKLFADMSKVYNIERGLRGSDKEHLSSKAFKELKDKEKELQRGQEQLRADREAFEAEKLKYKGIEPEHTILKKYNRAEVDKVVEERNFYITKCQELENHNREYRNRTISISEKLERAETALKGEHALRVELQDKLEDKEYLREHLRELEHSRTFERDR